MIIRLEDSFETLSQKEWNEYLSTKIFDDMSIEESSLSVFHDSFEKIYKLKQCEVIKDHNNKVGMLKITYALCRHYFDKGIPDEPYYISPGKTGQSVEYFPKFNEEHWMRKYWFNYFSDVFYLKMSALWDSVYEIIDEFYQYELERNLNFKKAVLERLKTDNPNLHKLLKEICDNKLYKDGQKYRIAAAHGTSIGEVKDPIKVQHNVATEIPYITNGKVTMKKVNAQTVIKIEVGNYVNVSTIMKHIEEYSKFVGGKIHEITALLQ